MSGKCEETAEKPGFEYYLKKYFEKNENNYIQRKLLTIIRGSAQHS